MGSTLARAFAIALACVLAACGESKPPPAKTEQRPASKSASYADPFEQRAFEDALNAQSIPFTKRSDASGKVIIEWAPEHDEKVSKVQREVAGSQPPEGRSISFSGDMNARLAKWCAENGIPVTTTRYRGREYIVWEAKDAERIAQWPGLPPGTFNRIK